MKRAFTIWGLLLLCLCGRVYGETLTVTPDLQPTSLTPVLRLLEDRGGELDFAQIQSPQYQARLTSWGQPAANFGYSRSAYWVAFTLRNPTEQPLSLLVRQDYPLIDYLDFWAQDSDGNWQRTATGDRRPFASRQLELREFIFSVTLPAQSERTFYLRYASQGAMNIGLSVTSETNYLSKLELDQLLLGIYYGGFLVLVIYNLFLFMAVRDRAYVYYMGYVLSYGLYFGALNGVTFQFVWPENPWLANVSLVFMLGLTLISGVQFAREICAGRQLAPRTDKLARLLLYILIPLTAISPFASYRLMVTTFTVFTLVASVLLLVMGAISLLRGSISARYFMMGWIALLASVIVYVFKTFGWLPHNAFTHNAFQVAALIEMMLLSLALGARVNEIRKRGYIDELSHLHNRRYFEEQLPREFSFAARSSTSLSLLMLDLDHFKAINDHYGHRQGDRAIRAIGDLILKQVRKPVLACRYGGEEFAILLPRTSEEQAAVIAQRLVCKVAELDLYEMPLTVSIGVASFERDNFEAALQLFEAADMALYRAKQQGRNRVVVSAPDAGQADGVAVTKRREPAKV
ncbi:diguanylate cyclase (GGDEF) domain-containing protein [Microbulbifer donghaiensis]|uniref:diguanylate cyclase n=1 Tax=Microbulbifer donghaiensis TaxID=494016 RepID=A0A1M5H8Z7_9GAMM|nr:diguanylate cyclase [Microbulbifer donghaiensis]SHG12424.1 diguanylate cyclase (GGDEF) domain-containing protein [Microbulbifer donghaiensis]